MHTGLNERQSRWNDAELSVTIVEQETTTGFTHALSLSDIRALLSALPFEDLRGLGFVVLHQPTRREDTTHPRWAAYVPEYSRGRTVAPAILIEATDSSKPLRWPPSLEPADQQELDRLEREGHRIMLRERSILISMDTESVRRTQLRSFLHELGHHVDRIRSPHTFERKTVTQKESAAIRYAREHEDVLDIVLAHPDPRS